MQRRSARSRGCRQADRGSGPADAGAAQQAAPWLPLFAGADARERRAPALSIGRFHRCAERPHEHRHFRKGRGCRRARRALCIAGHSRRTAGRLPRLPLAADGADARGLRRARRSDHVLDAESRLRLDRSLARKYATRSRGRTTGADHISHPVQFAARRQGALRSGLPRLPRNRSTAHPHGHVAAGGAMASAGSAALWLPSLRNGQTTGRR